MLKKIMLSVFALFLCGAGLRAEKEPTMKVTAVNAIQPNVSPEIIRYAVSHDRRVLFEGAMEDLLTSPEIKRAFWQVYDAYEVEKAGIADSRMNILAEYAKDFATMSDAKVKELMKRSFSTQSKELKIRNKYAQQLAKKTNATIAGRFWQADDFITAAVKVSLLSNIPLLGEKIQ